MEKGGYRTLKVSLPKTVYNAVLGICNQDERLVNKLVRYAIEKVFEEHNVVEIQSIIGLVEIEDNNEQEDEHYEEPE